MFLTGLVIALWFNVPQNRVTKAIKSVFIVGFGLLFALIGFIIVKASGSATDYNEDAVVVLGCAVRGTIPSNTLIRRLEKCVEYSAKNPHAIIVVSGGQGEQEHISEAEAMRRYLTEHGVSKDRIYIEERSTSTEENFVFSKAILDNLFDSDYQICYITNDFHSYRAGIYAQRAGFTNPRCCNASTNTSTLIPSYLREAVAVLHLWFFKN